MLAKVVINSPNGRRKNGRDNKVSTIAGEYV